MSIETGIAPGVLAETEQYLLDGLWAELAWRAKQRDAAEASRR